MYSSFNSETPEGSELLATAKRVLTNLGKPEADAVTLADATNTVAIFANTKLNGDGVIPTNAADGDELKGLITEIMATVGGVDDRAEAGSRQRLRLRHFFTAVAAYGVSKKGDKTVLPLGDKPAAAYAASGGSTCQN